MKEYLVEISAAIGALMVLARVVVYMTPTPRDDAALKKVSGWLKVIAAVTGMDLKRGIEKYKP